MAAHSPRETFDLYQRAMASTARILDLIEAPDSLVDGDVAPTREEASASTLRLENVTFAHRAGRPSSTASASTSKRKPPWAS